LIGEESGLASTGFEIVEHTADVGFRAWGPAAADLFAGSAQALMTIAADTSAIAGSAQYPVEAAGHDYESLMVNWLEEILYLFDTGQFAPREFVVDQIAPHLIRATLIGEPRNPARHPWKLIVKAITYHQIEVVQRHGRWEATVFVDV
jgi:SHS2 domain-containing protein